MNSPEQWQSLLETGVVVAVILWVAGFGVLCLFDDPAAGVVRLLDRISRGRWA